MISRRKEPEGKPFLRVPLDRKPAPKRPARKRPSRRAVEEQARRDTEAVERGNREQAREARELELLNRRRKPMAKGGKVKAYAKGGSSCGGKVKKMAKGGKVNHKGCGIAKRGLTKGKMV